MKVKKIKKNFIKKLVVDIFSKKFKKSEKRFDLKL